MKPALLLVGLFVLARLAWRVWQTGPLPEIGARAPGFCLPDQNGVMHALPDEGGRWLVLYFYPKDDTPGCTREACAFRDGLAKLEAAGASVVGISIDTPQSHQAFAAKYKLPFTLLADSDGRVAKQYGVLMDWSVFRLARRTTFLIGPDGRLRRIYRRVDPDRHAAEILADLAKHPG